VRKLPLSPTEGFVLSRIDGSSTAVDLSNATGLPESTVVEALARLRSLGAIRYPDAPPASNPRPTASGPRPGSASGGAPVTDSAPVSGAKPALPEVEYDAALLAEEVDIPIEQRKVLLGLFFAIDIATHYELLGVPLQADRKEVKQAYFERVNALHPDRFFGRSIGSYKARIERVFTALTKAHDTLTKRQSRADYDAYLASRKETIGLRSSRAPTPTAGTSPSADVIPAPGRAPQLDEVTAASPGAAFIDARELADSQPPRASSVPPAGGGDAARRHMARRLRNASMPPPAAPGRETGLPSEEQAEDARRALQADLRARYDARQKDPNAANRFLALAGESERTQSWASAVNALKAALDLQPDDPKILAELDRVELLADKAYAGKYVEQARYEEHDGQYERAARSYERAARGRGSADLYAPAALAQLRVANGGRRAVELARKAVALGPTQVGARLALARAYFQEGMAASAVAEATRALEVDPKSDEAKRLLVEFKKSG
jgi:curved DNA-binding protein CbpA